MYCTVEEIKTELDITDENYDSMLMAMMEQAKGFIDDYCDREFDQTAEARYFNGAGSILFIDDLVISTTTVELDRDGDGTHESTMASGDYVLYPLNKTPKTYIKISNNSNYGGFAPGIKNGVKITGTWGYTTIPAPIRRASIIQVCRWFKRSKGAYEDMVGIPEMGTFVVYKGLDPDVALLLNPYRKRNIG